MSLHVRHGGPVLPSVTVDDYNAGLRDGDGFLGDKVCNRAFRELLDQVRREASGPDPLGEAPSASMRKPELDHLLLQGPPRARAVLEEAIEAFSARFAVVARAFLDQDGWAGTQRIVVGGGFRASRLGERVIARTAALLRDGGAEAEMVAIRHDPDEAGLLGGAHLAPAWVFHGHDCLLAADIGGSNVRAGLVLPNHRRAKDGSRARVQGREHWRHRDEEPTRDEAVQRIVAMFGALIRRAEADGHRLAPFIALGCPGRIAGDGQIEQGGQNLPGDWEHERFNLPERLLEAFPRIGGHETLVVMHNDAVVQGLSEVPFMRDVERWGVLTVGTGLGNARFGNRG